MTFLVLLIALLLPLAAQARSLPRHFCAILDQSQVVPPTGDPAYGSVQVHVNYFQGLATDLDYDVRVTGGVSLTTAHFHCAPAGANGNVVAFLAGRHDGGVNVDHGLWVQANLDDTSITSTAVGLTNPVTCTAPGSPVVSTIQDLVTQALAGNVYVCLHDRAFPGGAIRGQLSTNCGGK